MSVIELGALQKSSSSSRVDKCVRTVLSTQSVSQYKYAYLKRGRN